MVSKSFGAKVPDKVDFGKLEEVSCFDCQNYFIAIFFSKGDVCTNFHFIKIFFVMLHTLTN